MIAWAAMWCPWLPAAEAQAVGERVIADAHRWKADTLAWRLRLTDAERTALKIKTIGGVRCVQSRTSRPPQGMQPRCRGRPSQGQGREAPSDLRGRFGLTDQALGSVRDKSPDLGTPGQTNTAPVRSP
jgi:hypothetical protein